ncbi:cytochrome b [Microvirga sp. SRT01]|uniref:Cytochrome b n=1 Tax=Sphingomonas longa TaxID=2778730 RepID=A0ABS2D6G2_9SPHN|nr:MULTISPECIES: cytochrome b [Alphaproteobacteria]MBM6576500.1 cytochrome b [Sphingomonas sp. BT552]MBR7709546.1 cytochrome b [Microvirga sp. SRT01]
MATLAHTQRGPSRGLRYTNVAIALHWAIAALILYNLTSGLLRPVLPRSFFVFHVSSGITILALTVVRVGWRLTHRPPPQLPMARWEHRLAHVVHFLLYAAMLLLPFSGWALVSANPPAGSPGAEWAAANRPAPPPPAPTLKPDPTSKGGPAGEGKGGGQPPRKRGPTMLWGVVALPLIGPVNEMGRTAAGVPGQRELHERIETFHALGGWVMLALLALHIAGALKHQFVDRERELARMGIGRRRKSGI